MQISSKNLDGQEKFWLKKKQEAVTALKIIKQMRELSGTSTGVSDVSRKQTTEELLLNVLADGNAYSCKELAFKIHRTVGAVNLALNSIAVVKEKSKKIGSRFQYRLNTDKTEVLENS